MTHPSTAHFEKPSTLRNRVEDYLRTAIMEGRMRGGDRLRENDLCEQLGISRPTLREALRTLEAERLIKIEPHRGPSVMEITEKAARDLYALRGLLEGFAAHEFARLADDSEIDRLSAAVQSLHTQAGAQDRRGLLVAKKT
ncbi:MAG: GntR family transcriptional regulator, partial [Burkholderiaceae bacterium]